MKRINACYLHINMHIYKHVNIIFSLWLLTVISESLVLHTPSGRLEEADLYLRSLPLDGDEWSTSRCGCFTP
jgi:hypothetical protein